MILEILKEASTAQNILKEFTEIWLFIFKHLPIGIELPFHLFLLCIRSIQEYLVHRKDRLKTLRLPDLFLAAEQVA